VDSLLDDCLGSLAQLFADDLVVQAAESYFVRVLVQGVYVFVAQDVVGGLSVLMGRLVVAVRRKLDLLEVKLDFLFCPFRGGQRDSAFGWLWDGTGLGIIIDALIGGVSSIRVQHGAALVRLRSRLGLRRLYPALRRAVWRLFGCSICSTVGIDFTLNMD